MSSTYTLGCVGCGARIWVGQGTSKPYLYATPAHLWALQRFMTRHMGHHLVYYMDGCEPKAMMEDEAIKAPEVIEDE